jgi:hypothetical protein
MLVLRHRVEHGLAGASATATIDSSRSNGTIPRPARPRRAIRRLDDALSLAVVAEARDFTSAGSPTRRATERRGRDPEAPEQLLLDEAVLPQLERARIGDGADGCAPRDGHVLELVRDGVRAVREPLEARGIVVGADDELADVAGASVRSGIEKAETHAERSTGEGEHPSELPAAEAADERRHAAGSGAASTASVCSSRNAARPLATPSSAARRSRRRGAPR